jgi:hypothetical protein
MRGRTACLWQAGSGLAKALLGAGWPGIGGVYKMPPTFGAELTARCVPAACEPTS